MIKNGAGWRGGTDAAAVACGPSSASAGPARHRSRPVRGSKDHFRRSKAVDRKRAPSPQARADAFLRIGMSMPCGHRHRAGADRRRALASRMSMGSSPRARGRPGLATPGLLPSRTIPASAGPTSSRNARRPRSGDHPRERGADVTWERIAMALGGPSPRLRGWSVRAVLLQRKLFVGPAPAGMVRRTTRPSRCRRSRPRACGDGPSGSVSSSRPVASASRAWGTTGLRPPAGGGGWV